MTTLKIDKLIYGGEGLGFLNGKACFVPGALPGETVEIELLQSKKNFSRARLIKIVEPSPARTEAPCRYVEDCGGCQYQHVSYEEELKWKGIQVREYLARNLKISEDLVKPPVGSSNPYHYRNSVTVHRAMGEKTGFFSEDNQNVLPVENCFLADERLAPAFKTNWYGIKTKMTYRLSAEGETVTDLQEKIFPIKVGRKLIYTSSKSFFQNNLEVTAQIGKALAAWVKKINPLVFVDLYSGVGTFSVLAAGSVKKIVCVEESRHSDAALQMNLDHLGIPHEILRGSVETLFADYCRRNPLEKPFIFVDPPRTGMVPQAAEFLSRQKETGALAYLSCHLGTLARDLGTLLKGGNYRVEQVIPFDMFPRTKHIEILTLLCPA